jgi:hypothetical protein
MLHEQGEQVFATTDLGERFEASRRADPTGH